MASYKYLAMMEFILVTITIVIQSAPIENSVAVQSSSINDKQQQLLPPVDSNKPSSIISTISQEKKKRNIDVDDLFDGVLDSSDSEEEDNHVLHAKIQETSAKIHDKTDKPVDIDDSRIYSESQMTPNQLSNVLRQRRSVKFHDQSNRRRKRALLPYDFYETNSLYDPYADFIEQDEYDRPIRSFAPIYWYPSVYRRSLRSALTPPLYESSEWPRLYSNTMDDDDDNSVFISDGDDEDDDYESNRYPILLETSNNPFDNFQLQQEYNLDDLPLFDENPYNNDGDDDDDDDEEEYRVFYPRERLRDTWVF